MIFDAERVRANARAADTEDLLDRVTIFAEGMEPEAVVIVETELRRRGVTAEQMGAHAARRSSAVALPDGTIARCSFCPRPAVRRGRGWFKLFRLVPVLPRTVFYCEGHRL